MHYFLFELLFHIILLYFQYVLNMFQEFVVFLELVPKSKQFLLLLFLIVLQKTLESILYKKRFVDTFLFPFSKNAKYCPKEQHLK